MRRVHRAGEKLLFIDYAAPQLRSATPAAPTSLSQPWARRLHLHLRYTPRDDGRLAGCDGQALCFFGGVPKLIVPDNPKALMKC